MQSLNLKDMLMNQQENQDSDMTKTQLPKRATILRAHTTARNILINYSLVLEKAADK